MLRPTESEVVLTAEQCGEIPEFQTSQIKTSEGAQMHGCVHDRFPSARLPNPAPNHHPDWEEAKLEKAMMGEEAGRQGIQVWLPS